MDFAVATTTTHAHARDDLRDGPLKSTFCAPCSKERILISRLLLEKSWYCLLTRTYIYSVVIIIVILDFRNSEYNFE